MNTKIKDELVAFDFIHKINLAYALVPLFFAYTFTLPVLEDNGVSLSLSNAFSAWVFCLFMMPSAVLLAFGYPKKQARIALASGVVACIALPIADGVFNLGFINDTFRSFDVYIREMRGETGYLYFDDLKQDPLSYMGSVWLMVPAFLLVIMAMIGPKYQVRLGSLPSLDELKQINLSELFEKLKANVQAVGVGELKKGVLGKVSTVSEGVSGASLPSFKGKPISPIVGVACLVVIFAFACSKLFTTDGPSEDEILKMVSSEVNAMGFSLDVHDYALKDCKQGSNGVSYRCFVTSRATLTHLADDEIEIDSFIDNELQVFVYRDGFLKADLANVLSDEARQMLALASLADALKSNW
ncbi:hypothetical protein AB6D75_24170 [Vibrio splendidus]